MFTYQHRHCSGCVLLLSVLTVVNRFGICPFGAASATENEVASVDQTDGRTAVNRTEVALSPLSTVPTDTLLVSSVSASMQVVKEAASSSRRPQTTDDEDSAVKDIWMIGLFPLKGSWPGGLGQRPAIEMGLEDVNRDPNILRGYRLRMTMDDTEVSIRH
jgi:hypothetical protein